MTDQQHPITPPPELVREWARPGSLNGRDLYIADQAARWGADQELKACCSWVSQFDYDDYSYGDRLRAARRGRTTPPSWRAMTDITTYKLDWGADQQLKQDAKWLDINAIRQAMRPKPPSLKELAQTELDRLIALIPFEGALAMAEPIRRALEALPE